LRQAVFRWDLMLIASLAGGATAACLCKMRR